MDLSVFAAVSGGLQQAYQSAKALLELKVEAETAVRINTLIGQLGDVTGKFLTAQTAHLQCQEKAMELENELARLKGFAAEKERYVLQQLAPYAYAYALRPEHQGEEPLHHLCSHCYAGAQKSILQFARLERGDRVLTCPRCQAEVRFPHGIPQPILTAAAPSRFRDF